MRRRTMGSAAGLGEPAEEMDRAPGRSKGSASKEKATSAAAMAVRGSHQGRRRTIAVQRQRARSKPLTRMTLGRRHKTTVNQHTSPEAVEQMAQLGDAGQ